jgi:hypothetical protein
MLTRTISLLDEDEQVWVVPLPRSVTAPMYVARPRASFLLQPEEHATTTWSIGGVDVKMSMYDRAT